MDTLDRLLEYSQSFAGRDADRDEFRRAHEVLRSMAAANRPTRPNYAFR